MRARHTCDAGRAQCATQASPYVARVPDCWQDTQQDLDALSQQLTASVSEVGLVYFVRGAGIDWRPGVRINGLNQRPNWLVMIAVMHADGDTRPWRKAS